MPKKRKNNFKVFYALSLAFQLGFLIAVPIVVFLLLGIWADNYFRTQPLLMIIGLLIGFVITIYEVHHLLKPLVKN